MCIRDREEEGHRCRVWVDRQRFNLQEALFRVGCSPGERTFTDDWTFWHGFEPEKEAMVSVKNRRMKTAKHGNGCGGSLEWITILKQRRAQANRRVQHEKMQPRVEKLEQLIYRVLVCLIQPNLRRPQYKVCSAKEKYRM